MTTPTDTELNALQAAGIISDHCVTWDDVAAVDRARALEWLTNDPSSATAATERNDCNKSGPPPFAAAHG